MGETGYKLSAGIFLKNSSQKEYALSKICWKHIEHNLSHKLN